MKSSVDYTLIRDGDQVSIQFQALRLLPGEGITPTVIPPFPEEFYIPMGAIAIAWGAIELRINKHISTLLSSLDRDVPGWKMTNFRKRRELLKSLLKEVFAQHPAIVIFFSQLLGEAASVHRKRNFIMHGLLAFEVEWIQLEPDVKLEPLMLAHSIYKGKNATESFNLKGLNQLAYQIMHLNAMLCIFDGGFEAHLIPLSSQERSLAQAVLGPNDPYRSSLGGNAIRTRPFDQ